MVLSEEAARDLHRACAYDYADSAVGDFVWAVGFVTTVRSGTSIASGIAHRLDILRAADTRAVIVRAAGHKPQPLRKEYVTQKSLI